MVDVIYEWLFSKCKSEWKQQSALDEFLRHQLQNQDTQAKKGNPTAHKSTQAGESLALPPTCLCKQKWKGPPSFQLYSQKC